METKWLIHSGVPGMKWGVSTAKSSGGGGKSSVQKTSKKPINGQDDITSHEWKKVVKKRTPEQRAALGEKITPKELQEVASTRNRKEVLTKKNNAMLVNMLVGPLVPGLVRLNKFKKLTQNEQRAENAKIMALDPELFNTIWYL